MSVQEHSIIKFLLPVHGYTSSNQKHFNSQIIDLDEKITISDEKYSFSGDDLRRRQYTFGMSLEDLELILENLKDPKYKTGFDRNFWIWEEFK